MAHFPNDLLEPGPAISVMRMMRALEFIGDEIREALPPIAFFLVSFNLVELTTQLILDDYMARLANYMFATTAALVVGKAVLVANTLPFLENFNDRPMIWPVLFKTTVYWGTVFAARVLELSIESWIRLGSIRAAIGYIVTQFSWNRFAAVQIWIFVLFFLYTSANELHARLGDRGLVRVFFARPESRSGTAGRGGC